MVRILYSICSNMWKKSSQENISAQPYEFSQLYRIKRNQIQDAGYSDFIEFLNWIENVNQWKKKEDWKRLIDLRFNKYSNNAIIWLFNMFVRFKYNKPVWYKYENLLNDAKSAFRTEIYWENIVKPLFWYYWGYLKYVKKKKIEVEIAQVLKSENKEWKNDEQNKWLDEPKILENKEHFDGAENHYGWSDRDIMNEDWDIVPNPDQEHIEMGNPESLGDDRRLTKIEKKNPENWEIYIPFDFED